MGQTIIWGHSLGPITYLKHNLYIESIMCKISYLEPQTGNTFGIFHIEGSGVGMNDTGKLSKSTVVEFDIWLAWWHGGKPTQTMHVGHRPPARSGSDVCQTRQISNGQHPVPGYSYFPFQSVPTSSSYPIFDPFISTPSLLFPIWRVLPTLRDGSGLCYYWTCKLHQVRFGLPSLVLK